MSHQIATVAYIVLGAILALSVDIIVRACERRWRKNQVRRIIKEEVDRISSDMETSKTEQEQYLAQLSEGIIRRVSKHYPTTYFIEELGQELFILEDPIPRAVLSLRRKLWRLENRLDVRVQIRNTVPQDFGEWPLKGGVTGHWSY
ncbi:MAG: hypothetical protein HXS48_16755 [Theionarchaea archaeon]|nr:hypothetical protein [Theionarchaea archaeon]